jgi:hypothetical protein
MILQGIRSTNKFVFFFISFFNSMLMSTEIEEFYAVDFKAKNNKENKRNKK